MQKNDECGSSFGSIDNNATNNEPLLFGGGIHSSNIADDGSDATTKPSFCRRSSFTDHHFVMTAHLFEEGLLNDNDNAGGCTVINVASIAHRASEIYCGQDGETSNDSKQPTFGFDFANINSELEYGFGEAYARGKLANVMFTKELQNWADLAKKGWLTTVSLEPRGVTTDVLGNILLSALTQVERGANAHV